MSKPKPMIILMRHGQTDWNKTSRLMSRTDLPLSKEGVAQCVSVAMLNKQIPITSIISSPMSRALQTAEIMAKTFTTRPEITIDSDLREIDFGILEGMTGSEVRASPLAAAYEGWLVGKTGGIVGAESWAAAARRCKRAYSQVNPVNGSTLIVSHGYTCRLLLVTQVINTKFENLRALRLDNARFATIEKESGLDRLTSFNVTDLNGVQDESPTS